jgi:hypothetical protein
MKSPVAKGKILRQAAVKMDMSERPPRPARCAFHAARVPLSGMMSQNDEVFGTYSRENLHTPVQVHQDVWRATPP